MEPKRITAEEFDRLFDEGETDILQYCDLTRAVSAHPIDTLDERLRAQENRNEPDKHG